MKSADQPDSGFGAALYEQIFELWVEPELDRRGEDAERGGVMRALVVMPPRSRVKTLLNNEAQIVADVRTTRAIEKGEAVGGDDFSDILGIRPLDVDPDTAWVCFAQIGAEIHIAFDFRRNRARAGRILERAREFAAAARLAMDGGLIGPSIDAAYAAAELSVVARMYLMDDEPPRDHQKRKRWYVAWSELGNTPIVHSRALTTLAKGRGAARYADKAIGIDGSDLSSILDVVEAMILEATAAVSPPTSS